MGIRIPRLTSVLLLMSVQGPRPLTAQDSTAVRLIGEVRDFAADQPIVGAAVKVLELDRVQVTDRNGFFAFDSLPPGTWTFETSQLGYRTNVEASTIVPNSFLLVRLEARPIELEGLYVSVVQTLARRRMAAPSRVLVWSKPELESAVAPDIGSFVRTRGVAQFVRCGGEFSANDLPNCFMHRGGPVRIRLFVDDIEVPRATGMSELWAYDPRDLWTVEFLPSCGELRLYTIHFMEMVESGRVQLAPTVCVSGVP